MIMTKSQREGVFELYSIIAEYENDKTYKPAKLEDIFVNAPAGDFCWEGEEAGDWHVYQCGESDCEVGWHKMAYTETIGRENGERYLNIDVVDEDGNWDINEQWGEGWDFTEIGISLARRVDDYFLGWAKYYLYCAEHAEEILEKGYDPLHDLLAMPEKDKIVSFFINAAKEKIESIYQIENLNAMYGDENES